MKEIFVMTLALRTRALVPVFVFILALASGAAFGAAARLRIKNGHGIVVSLGKTREPAAGVRPDKKVWTLELDAQSETADRDAAPARSPKGGL
jgi:hypothetical protein